MKNKIAVLANSTVMTAKKLVRKIREDKTFTLVKARQSLGKFISIEEELKYKDNLTCFVWFIDIISTSVMNNIMKKKIILEELRKKYHEEDF